MKAAAGGPRHARAREHRAMPTRGRARRQRAGAVTWRGVWRQTRAELAPLTVGVVVVVVAAFLAAAVPQAMERVATEEVQRAVTAAQSRGDLVVTVPYSSRETDRYELEVGTADTASWMRDLVDEGIPPALRDVISGPVTTLVGPEMKAGMIDGRPGRARFIYLESAGGAAVEWLEGAAPAATISPEAAVSVDTSGIPIEVAVSEQTASIMDVKVGDAVGIDTSDGLPLDVVVSGVYRAADPADPAWSVQPTLLEPHLVDGSAAVSGVGLMVSAESIPYARLALFPTQMTRAYTYSTIPTAFDGSATARVATEARGLASGREAFAINDRDVVVTTQLDRVLDEALARINAGAAQAAVLLISLLAAAVVVILLTAKLVAERRGSVLTQLRARGATLAAIAWAAAIESIPLAALGGAIGVVAARAAAGGTTPWLWVIPPLAIAGAASPLLAVRAASRSASGRGSSTRGSSLKRGSGRNRGFASSAVRRLAAEALLVLAAGGALFTLRARGVEASAGSVAADAAVLGAPVLAILALAVLMTRAQPHAQRVARAAAVRAKGAVPLLAAARTRVSGMAIAALVMAGATTAIAASVAMSVNGAQGAAAWDAVGAEVAVSTVDANGLPAALTDLDGVDGLTVATATVLHGAQLIGPRLDESVDIVVVDASAMATLLATTGASDEQGRAHLESLSGGGLRLLADDVAGDGDGASLRWGDDAVEFERVGAVPSLPRGLATNSSVVIVDRDALVAAVGHDFAVSHAWVVGADAEARVSAALANDSATYVSRDGWLAGRQDAPVTRALGFLFAGTAAVAAAFAVLAVVLLVASGASDRMRAVARSRVVGAPRTAAERVAWLEVVIPVVIMSTGGMVAGFALAAVLVGALDLASVTGGDSAPALVIPWWSLALPCALALIARAGAGVGSLARRKDRLGPLMRLG